MAKILSPIRQAPPPDLDPERDALFLDYDGTLTEIAARPEAAILSEGRRDILQRVAQRFGGAVAIVSGRALADLTARVGDTFWRAGGHGHQTAAPGEGAPTETRPAPEPLLRAANAMARQFAGVIVEEKPGGLALHYRQNPDAGPACIAAMELAARDAPDHVLQHGKMVIEARPKGADKGTALRLMMQSAPFAQRRPVMVGDDLTDETAMQAALDLGGLAVKVGDGSTLAPVRIADPDAVYRWLTRALA